MKGYEGVLCLSLFWCALFYVLSSFAIALINEREREKERERDGCFAVIVLRMSCCC